jgi:hypothetical protein
MKAFLLAPFVLLFAALFGFFQIMAVACCTVMALLMALRNKK